jgi:hypothetical protein
MKKKFLYLIFCLLFLPSVSLTYSEYNIRIATYDIGKLFDENTEQQAKRLKELKQNIAALDAQIIAFQGNFNRKVFNTLFNSGEFTFSFDDDGATSYHKLAIAVREPFRIESSKTLLFNGVSKLLVSKVMSPKIIEPYYILNYCAIDRFGGRIITDCSRIESSKSLLHYIVSEDSFKQYVLLGNFNDSPDDASLNILEKGDLKASAEMENNKGPFLINLTEPLLIYNQVSYLKYNRSEINKVVPDSRQLNFAKLHGYEEFLSDQILVPPNTYNDYIEKSANIFNSVVINSYNDLLVPVYIHLPVCADFAVKQKDYTLGPPAYHSNNKKKNDDIEELKKLYRQKIEALKSKKQGGDDNE